MRWRFAWPGAAIPAQVVEFVEICYGTSSFAIPGTNSCVDANQIVANQLGVVRQASIAFTGIAMTTALVEPFVPDHANFAVSIHEESFEFVKVCGEFGPGFFFIPGTDGCVDANQINETQAALAGC